MGANIRMPNITGLSEAEQLKQIKGYLYQLREELQWAFDNIGTSEGSSSVHAVQQVNTHKTSNQSGSSGVEQNFGNLKALIIKSEDIVNAYYDEISRRLEGVYVAQSAFGTYAQETSQTIEENAESTTQRFENIQSVVSANSDNLHNANNRITNTIVELDRVAKSFEGSLDDVQLDMAALLAMVTDVEGYIKSGLLYYTDEGMPVYGVEIGQDAEVNGEKVFNKYARFTSEKLAFYDSNDVEVAYISDRKLYIGHAEITVSLKYGGFIDEIDARTGDVVTKWLGGELDGFGIANYKNRI